MTVHIIATSRLILRSASNFDLDQLYDIVFSDPEVMSQAFEGKPLSRKQAADFFTSSFDHDGNGMQLGVLTLKDSGRVIGFAGLLESTALGKQDFEIGFVLGREFWGRGHATEIGLAQIQYGLVQKNVHVYWLLWRQKMKRLNRHCLESGCSIIQPSKHRIVACVMFILCTEIPNMRLTSQVFDIGSQNETLKI